MSFYHISTTNVELFSPLTKWKVEKEIRDKRLVMKELM